MPSLVKIVNFYLKVTSNFCCLGITCYFELFVYGYFYGYLKVTSNIFVLELLVTLNYLFMVILWINMVKTNRIRQDHFFGLKTVKKKMV